MKISLVIPAYNEENYIGQCLESAIKHSNNRFSEIIVVDNASTDKTAEIASQFPGVKVVRENRKGLTRARQCGLENATGDLIAYVDADSILHKTWLDKVIHHFDKRPDMVIFSGPYRYYDAPLFRKWFMNGIWYISAPITYWSVGYMALGGNFVAKRQALLDIGGFDSNIEFYGEDTDIARRLSKKGKSIFKMNFFIYSSSRRFAKEGLIKANFTYAMNFIWQVIFHKPFTKDYQDIRL